MLTDCAAVVVSPEPNQNVLKHIELIDLGQDEVMIVIVTRSGTVFAVAFSGPSIPDLRVLLAQHYAAYLAEAARPRVNHRAMSIESPGLVLSIVKLPRGFVGSAHVPTLVPAGVAPRELR